MDTARPADNIPATTPVPSATRGGRALVAVLTRFPVTTLTAAPYLLVIVPMAVWNHNEQTPFILRLLALALASTAVVEGLARCGGDRGAGWEARLRAANSGYPRLWLVARIVAGVSVVADVVGAYAGRGTVVTQLSGQVASSPAAGLSALVSGWSYLAFGLIVAAYWAGAATRRGLWLWTAILVAAQVYVASLTAILAPLIGYLSLIVAVGALFGLIRARHIAVLIAVVFLLWPTIFEVRNEIRRTEGVAVAQDQTATHRLRFDLQLSAASGYDVPVALGQPGFAAILRYGAVPRVLDPGRPAIATSSDINRYIGGDPNSSYSFLALGTVYFLSGPGGVVLYYAGWAVAVLVLLRWRGAPGPARLGLLCFVLGGPLVWSSTYPGSMIAVFQHAVSAVPVFVVLWATRVRSAAQAAEPPAAPPHPPEPPAGSDPPAPPAGRAAGRASAREVATVPAVEAG